MASDPPSLIQWLGVAGGAAGFASLLWNIAQFRLAGHRAKIETTKGASIASLDPLTVIPNITVRMWNAGRAPITVRDIEIHSVGSTNFGIAWTDWKGKPLPHRLEQGEEGHWRIEDVGMLREMLRLGDHNLACKAVAVLANGRKVKSDVFIADPDKILNKVTFIVTDTSGRVLHSIGDEPAEGLHQSLSPDP